MGSQRAGWGWIRTSAVVVAAAAAGFWIVGLGVGWRAWLLLNMNEPNRGLVAHVKVFGTDASAWWVPATVLTLTAVVLAVAASFRPNASSPIRADSDTEAEPTPDSSSAAHR